MCLRQETFRASCSRHHQHIPSGALTYLHTDRSSSTDAVRRQKTRPLNGRLKSRRLLHHNASSLALCLYPAPPTAAYAFTKSSDIRLVHASPRATSKLAMRMARTRRAAALRIAVVSLRGRDDAGAGVQSVSSTQTRRKTPLISLFQGALLTTKKPGGQAASACRPLGVPSTEDAGAARADRGGALWLRRRAASSINVWAGERRAATWRSYLVSAIRKHHEMRGVQIQIDVHGVTRTLRAASPWGQTRAFGAA